MDLLLDDLGLDLARRLALARRLQAGLRDARAGGGALDVQLGAQFRRERSPLEALWAANPADDSYWLAPGLNEFRARSAALRPIVVELRERERTGELTVSIEELAASFLHMHANRMLRSAHSAQELVLYDFLRRIYESRSRQPAPG